MGPKYLGPPSKPKRNRPCVICGKRFTPQRIDARYCSNACRQKAFRWRREAKKG